MGVTAQAVRPRTALGAWWWSLDRAAVGLIAALAAVGAVVALASGPAAAARLGLADPYHFVSRHMAHLVLAAVIAIALSTLSPRGARRFAVLLLGGAVVLLAATLAVGVEVKGARRWLAIGPLSLQTVEFVKPALVVTTAWLFAAEGERDAPPGAALATAAFVIVAGLLIAQPDFGQTMLLAATFVAVAFLAGAPWRWLAGLLATAAALAALAYVSLPHVADRIDRFLNPAQSDTYQVDRAREAIGRGGLFGAGPGEGEIKRVLPDANTDFVIAVAAEEFGVVFCLGVAGVFAGLSARVLTRARRLSDATSRTAAAGLALLIAGQAAINIAASVGAAPPTGMTLPFISYGGSSLVAMGVTVGLILAFTRRRPGAFATS